MADTDTAPTAADQGEADPIAQAGSTPDSVTVNAQPDQGPQTQTPDAGQVNPAPTVAAPTVLVKQRRGGLAGIVDEFRDAVAGTQGRGVYINPDTGERFVQHPDLTGKQQWAKIAGEALVGATAGFAAGHGAGNQAKAPFAGVQAQQQLIDKNRQTQDQQAEQDYERDKQAKLAKANSQLLATQVAANQFKLQRMGVDATQQDADFAAKQEDRERGLGSADLGTYGFDNLHEVQKQDPDFWSHHYADNSIRSIPAYDADGKRVGIHLFLRQPGIGDQPAPEGSTVNMFVAPQKPGDQPTWKTITVTGHHTLNDLDAFQSTQDKKNQDYQLAQQKFAEGQATIGEKKAQTANAYSEAGEHREKTKELQQAALPTNSSGDIDLNQVSQSDKNIADGMYEGKIKPTDLGRSSGPQKLYYMKLAQAMHPDFGTDSYPVRLKVNEDFTGSGKDAVQLQSARTFLVHAANMSNVVNTLRNTGSPYINVPLNKLATMATGNAALSAAIAPLLAERTEYLNFLNNNHALGKEDKEEGQKLMNLDMTPAQMQASLKAQAHTAAGRMDETNNKYVEVFHRNAPGALSPASVQAMHHFGLDSYAQRLGSSQGSGTFSLSAWQKANPQGDPNAATAAAKAKGYTVTQ